MLNALYMTFSELLYEYNIIFYCTFTIYLIIKPCYIVNMEPVKVVHHISFFSYMKDLHNIFHRCYGVYVVYEMLCKFRFPIFIFKISEMLLKPYMKRSASLSNIFSITVLTCYFINTTFIELVEVSIFIVS